MTNSKWNPTVHSLHHELLPSAPASPFLPHGSRYTWLFIAPEKCQEQFLSFASLFLLQLPLLTMPSLHSAWLHFFGPAEHNAGRPLSRKSFLALSPLCTQCECWWNLQVTAPSLTSPHSALEWVTCWLVAPTRQCSLCEHCSIYYIYTSILWDSQHGRRPGNIC